MSKLYLQLGALLLSILAVPAHTATTATNIPAKALKSAIPDSKQMERDLQSMNWRQFRSIVEAIPKLKAEIEAYGPAGWQYIRAKYPTHPWQKNIDRLDVADKQQLARLIQRAKAF